MWAGAFLASGLGGAGAHADNVYTVGLGLGAKLLNFGLQRTGFRGCFRCFRRGCNSLHSTVSVPVSIFPPFQLGRVDTVGTVIQTFCAELPIFYGSGKRWLAETSCFRSLS